MVSFQVINQGKGIQISGDEQGMATLVEALKKIQPTGGHIHLRTPANGGKELDKMTPWGEEDTIGEVIITWSGDD
jgi:hypothetical protein